jgi:hypothetical protein
MWQMPPLERVQLELEIRRELVPDPYAVPIYVIKESGWGSLATATLAEMRRKLNQWREEADPDTEMLDNLRIEEAQGHLRVYFSDLPNDFEHIGTRLEHYYKEVIQERTELERPEYDL